MYTLWGLSPRQYDLAGLEWGSGIRMEEHRTPWCSFFLGRNLFFLGTCLPARCDYKGDMTDCLTNLEELIR